MLYAGRCMIKVRGLASPSGCGVVSGQGAIRQIRAGSRRGDPWMEAGGGDSKHIFTFSQDNQKPTVKQNEETKVVSVYTSTNDPV